MMFTLGVDIESKNITAKMWLFCLKASFRKNSAFRLEFLNGWEFLNGGYYFFLFGLTTFGKRISHPHHHFGSGVSCWKAPLTPTSPLNSFCQSALKFNSSLPLSVRAAITRCQRLGKLVHNRSLLLMVLGAWNSRRGHWCGHLLRKAPLQFA